ncbi:uncharacterized protein PHACADRAFT_191847 [Phanerochaete carnosa HHB-10118-sp]|uniref:Uncharacterized protein n=1 Tax=Phanerochaete carnosa (strain HHB-10118-sp) TaxID=650164 RepID=K5WK11_PHACS|nr:uncharacterized protein PHACADRAFT_191847 [Phanerochaete carnosa HHB-10118-sp]EKM59479.1 hypothetical protein PHACADRAFT_191847 [Phanerochaete carnosa HHB-10118-sp]
MSTAANPYAPYLAINPTAPLSAITTPYPPAGPVLQATASPSLVPPADRQAIIALPVKAPHQWKRAVKTGMFINEEEVLNGELIPKGPIGGQEQAEQAG